MQRVRGIGGVFFKAREPHKLAAWYAEHLGVPIGVGETYGMFEEEGGDGPVRVVWSAFPDDTTYFGDPGAPLMINYRVDDLDALLQQLRDAGADVDGNVEEYSYGRFGWAHDPEGNRFELWEPPEGDPFADAE